MRMALGVNWENGMLTEASWALQNESQRSWSSGKAGEENGPSMWLGWLSISARRDASAPPFLCGLRTEDLFLHLLFSFLLNLQHLGNEPVLNSNRYKNRYFKKPFIHPSTIVNKYEFLLCARRYFSPVINGDNKTDTVLAPASLQSSKR